MKKNVENEVERKNLQERKELTRKYDAQLEEKNEKIHKLLKNYQELLLKQQIFESQMEVK